MLLSETITIQREGNRYWSLKYLQQEKIKEVNAVIIKTSGKKPIAEIDVLFSFQPFHPCTKKKGSSSKDTSRVGESVTLKIDRLDPRGDQLVLREKDV